MISKEILARGQALVIVVASKVAIGFKKKGGGGHHHDFTLIIRGNTLKLILYNQLCNLDPP